MMNTIDKLSSQIDQACRAIAPLWPLKHFVAVNPFVGYADRPFSETSEHLKQVHGDYPLPKISWFLEQYRENKIETSKIVEAIAHASDEIRRAFANKEVELKLETFLQESIEPFLEEEVPYQLETFSSYVDKREGSQWNHLLKQEAAKWCAAHFDKGQSSWRSPWCHLSFFEAWRKSVKIDKSLDCSEIYDTRKVLAKIPHEPLQAIANAMDVLQIPQERVADILERTLLKLTGWGGYLRYLDRENELRGKDSDYGLQLLAVLLSYEVILHHNLKSDHDRMLGWQRSLQEDLSDTGETSIPFDLALRLLWQESLERSIEKSFQQAIQPAIPDSNDRPTLQAVFCIDVRSERFRRALESVMPKAQTIGFAGFFGIPAEHHIPGKPSAQALCPALLAPPVKTARSLSDLTGEKWQRLEFEQTAAIDRKRAWKGFRESASSCFTFVETFGLSYAYKIIKDAFGMAVSQRKPATALPQFAQAMQPADRVNLAESILRGINLTHNFAKRVLICGHGGECANNPYASSLDCGACGGHAGDVNARLAANLLNQNSVRQGLEARGINIPEDTTFIAGLHNTTTDEVTLFDAETKPTLDLEKALAQAGDICLLQRVADLDTSVKKPSLSKIRAKSRDWSQVRPEWGLAGNAAFIVAPRSWTQQSNLSGKAFLHEYDPQADPEGALLNGILGGPLVVGSWINLQYYASSTDNNVYGSGHKAIHNVVGGIGVALGNEYDLRPGLPLQSVSDGTHLVHTPCRLHACIAANPATLDKILEQQPHLKDLVTNGWIHMISLGEDGSQWLKLQANGTWTDSQREIEEEAQV
ncbi:DUF2309 domain-containing protein [Pelagicoccus enzymogenes]|uniref:YbcC family protein n=1 Tax=Pelagicoccus enzymogenes TaxID=2773457 RepID=UPI00280DE200|nr:DUF2309 domain-containing protein [Pelagicoccus enzymogenes]MDQ8198674.1 DUF2309 domain-containing protein [Pelagicoccus enzymogenes]